MLKTTMWLPQRIWKKYRNPRASLIPILKPKNRSIICLYLRPLPFETCKSESSLLSLPEAAWSLCKTDKWPDLSHTRIKKSDRKISISSNFFFVHNDTSPLVTSDPENNVKDFELKRLWCLVLKSICSNWQK